MESRFRNNDLTAPSFNKNKQTNKRVNKQKACRPRMADYFMAFWNSTREFLCRKTCERDFIMKAKNKKKIWLPEEAKDKTKISECFFFFFFAMKVRNAKMYKKMKLIFEETCLPKLKLSFRVHGKFKVEQSNQAKFSLTSPFYF